MQPRQPGCLRCTNIQGMDKINKKIWMIKTDRTVLNAKKIHESKKMKNFRQKKYYFKNM